MMLKTNRRLLPLIALITALFFLPSSLFAALPPWPQYVKQLRQEALRQGIRPAVFDAAFRGLHAPKKRVLHLDRTQPEQRLTFLKYRNTRADAFRIKLGRRELKRYNRLLQQIGDEYGVSPCFITALWGLETSYGRFMGSFPVIHSLATLSYKNRRAAFFRKQLFYALHIVNDGHVALKDYKGEWAGASGQPQFLPSSFNHYAVDYNGDGKKDIWKNMGDIFASIANYLKQNGWQSNGPWSVPVVLSSHLPKSIMSLKVKKTVNQWRAMGVHAAYGYRLPSGNLQASVVRPYGGPNMMVFNNFNVIMRWNRSIYYAGTVGYTAEKICRRHL
jgi:membrane-bound lytic murein transglycosylase B